MTLIDDGVQEGRETVALTLAGSAGYQVANPGTHTLSIVDDETPAVSFASASQSAGEGSGTSDVSVTLSPAPAAGLTLEYYVGGTATAARDFTIAGSGTLAVAAGATTAAIAVTVIDDNSYDGRETVVLTLIESGAAYQLGSPASHTLTIVDNETAPFSGPAVTIAAGTSPVTEGGSATFTLTATPPPAADLPVTVTVATDGDWGVTAGPRTVTIPTTGSATLTLATTGDDTDEPDGSVTATVTDGDGYTVGSAASGSVIIQDDDAPETTPDWTDYQTVVSYLIEVRDNPKNTAVKGNAVHIAKWNRVLEALGHDTGTGVAPMAASEIHANAAQWPDSPFKAASVYLKSQEQDPDEPAVTVSAGAASVTEGGDAVFTVTATPAPSADLAVSVTVATAGAYGISAGTRTVTVPTTGSATLTLATTDDAADEPDGSVTVTVTDGAGYTVGASASGSITIADDDAPAPEVATVDPALIEKVRALAGQTHHGQAHVNRWRRVLVAFGTVETYPGLTPTTAAEAEANAQKYSSPLWPRIAEVLAKLEAASEPDTEPVTLPAVRIAGGAAVTEGGDAVFTLTADRAPASALTVELAVSETGAGDHVAAPDEGPATLVLPRDATEATFAVATVNDAVDEPDGSATVTVEPGAGYTVGAPASASVEVTDDDAPSTAPALSVGDSTAKEGARLPVMPFTVRLTPPAPAPVRVYVSTRPSTPVSAEPGRDYAPGSSDLTFRAGETEKQVWIRIYDDSHDEGAETFEVVLSQARGATIGDGVAVGTIVNDDPMPAAWLARFGRTVAEQALDGIAHRMAAPRAPGMRGTLAGRALDFDAPAGGAPGAWSGAGPGAGDTTTGTPALAGTGARALADIAQAFGGHPGRPGHGGVNNGFGHDAAGFDNGFGETHPQSLTAREALLGSSFTLTGQRDGAGGSMAFWGRASQGGFDGREGTFSFDGAATTALLGADYARGRWLIGLALAQSAGEGEYRDTKTTPRSPSQQACPADAEGTDAELCRNAVRAGDGRVEASLTAALPYASVQASERWKLWGAVGVGAGEVTLKTAMGGRYTADTTWRMAAAGVRGALLGASPEGAGPALAVTSDALWTRTSSDRTRDLAASASDATRLRLGLEGSWRIALDGAGHSETEGAGRRAGGASLVPKLELGARHDGGDAETGFGLELGGGLAWSDPALGLTLDVSGRTLLAHENDALEGPGLCGLARLRPGPGNGAGTIAQPAPGVRRARRRRARCAVRARPAGGPHGRRGGEPLDDGGGLRRPRLRRSLDREPPCRARARHRRARLQRRLATRAGGGECARLLVRSPGDAPGERRRRARAHARVRNQGDVVGDGALVSTPPRPVRCAPRVARPARARGRLGPRLPPVTARPAKGGGLARTG